jgi:phosphonate transport system ATP-binding protein
VRFAPPAGPAFEMTTARGRPLRHARRQMGVVFQEFNLVERLSVLENVLLGRLGWLSSWRTCLYGFTDHEAREALAALAPVKMESFAARRAGTLSRGEMQRVALARAIFQKPAMFLVDEPISSVDPANARAIMELLSPLAKSSAVLGAFHQPEMTARFCTRVVAIRQGVVVYDGPPSIEQGRLAEIYGEDLPP